MKKRKGFVYAGLVVLVVLSFILIKPVFADTVDGFFNTLYARTIETSELWVQNGVNAVEISNGNITTSTGTVTGSIVNAQDGYTIGIDNIQGYTGFVIVGNTVFDIKGGIIVNVSFLKLNPGIDSH